MRKNRLKITTGKESLTLTGVRYFELRVNTLRRMLEDLRYQITYTAYHASAGMLWSGVRYGGPFEATESRKVTMTFLVWRLNRDLAYAKVAEPDQIGWQTAVQVNDHREEIEGLIRKAKRRLNKAKRRGRV